MAAPIYHLVRLIKQTGANGEKFQKILDDNQAIFHRAQGSAHNHQAWPGGYLQHVTDCIRIARIIYSSAIWDIPFPFSSAIIVLFLHDIEKPFMQDLGEHWSKEKRAAYRQQIIEKYNITLTADEQTALLYVEGEGADYSPTERKMNELCALCHAADVLSARLWHSRNKPVVDEWSD